MQIDEIYRLNLLMVTPRYFPCIGGIETHVYEVSRRLAAQGMRVTVLTTMPENFSPPLPSEDTIEGVRVIRVQAWPSNRDYYLAPEIRSIIKQEHWDLIHCQGCHTFVPPMAMIAAREAKIPYILTFHTGGHSSGWRNSIRGIQWQLLRPLLADATSLVGVSQFEADYFQKFLRLPASKFSVINNGVTLPNLSHIPLKRSKQIRIVSVARLERYKGHQHLIRALPRLLVWYPDAQLQIIGKGPYEDTLRKLAESLGVSDRVEIRVIPGEDRQAMVDTLAQASCVALLSEYEAHPIAVIEALAIQRPVLVSATSGLKELADKGFVRSISSPDSPEEVAWAIHQQIEEPIMPPSSLALSTWEQCTDNLLELYRASLWGTACVF